MTIADRIGQRLKRSSEQLYELIEYNRLYHTNIQNNAITLEQAVSGLQQMTEILNGISREISIAAEGMREADELTEEMATELAYSTSVAANMMDVFGRSDPALIAQFLEIADPAPREQALQRLAPAKLAEWLEAINKAMADEGSE